MYKWARYKLKAGALQFTLFIGVLIALMLAAFLLLSHINKTFQQKTDMLLETIQLADDGIAWASGYSSYADKVTNNQYPDLKDYQSLVTTSTYWGTFEWIKSTAYSKKYSFERNALLGGRQNSEVRNAITLPNTFSPLVVVGNTQIIGDVTLSEYGVKAGSMGSAYYTGKQLINGKINQNNSEKLTELTNVFRANLESWIIKYPPKTAEILDLNGQNRYNSFKNETKWIFSSNSIFLTDSIEGNIVIKSESQITVTRQSYLNQLILIAPEIIIENETYGNFQAFASKTIDVGKNVVLDYPTSLVVVSQKKTVADNTINKDFIESITIGDNARISGSIYFLGTKQNLNYEPEILLHTGSSLVGEIYCEQNIELKGKVIGSIYAKAFIAREFGSVYRNHLYNGSVDATALISEYVGIPFENTNKGIAKWIY